MHPESSGPDGPKVHLARLLAIASAYSYLNYFIVKENTYPYKHIILY